MPVDKFGRMSDTKTRDTGVSLTYINNNYIRSDGTTPVSGSLNMNGNTLFNLPNPKNLQDVATKEYADKITSLLNASIIKLSKLYITLSRTVDENKQKINKTQEEINKRIDETQENINNAVIRFIKKSYDLNNRIVANEEKIKQDTNVIVLNAGYKGRLNSGDYQFSFLGNIINKEKSIGVLIPHSGYIKSIVLETPFDFSKQQNYDKNMEYVALKIPLFKVVIEKKIQKKKC